jgi:hypothetical protein
MLHRKSLILIGIGFILTSNLLAQNMCDSILQHGIYDKANILDQKSKYKLVKDIYCKSSDTNFGLDVLSESIDESLNLSLTNKNKENFCSSKYEEINNNSSFNSIISKVSATITEAWSECIKNNYGTSHYIETTTDPSKFTYKILFLSDGEPYETEILSWNISGTNSCKDALPKVGQQIGSSGYLIQCNRNPKETVLISANVKTGGKNIKGVELPAYVVSKPTKKQLPKRTIFNLSGQLYKSIGYWAHGTHKNTFNCKLDIPKGYELVVVSTKSQNIGKKRGVCITNQDYCNSAGEYCVEVFFDKACYVNSEWHSWYKEHTKQFGIPYNKKTVCQKN